MPNRQVCCVVRSLARAAAVLAFWTCIAVPGNARVVAATASPSPAAPARLDQEPCIACGGAVDADAIHEIYRGRTVTVCSAGCGDYWKDHKDELFTKLQARGALFDEGAVANGGGADVERRDANATGASRPDTVAQGSLFSGWMWFGCYVVVGLVGGAICSYVALGKGLAPVPWLLAGLAFNVGAIVAVLRCPRGDLSALPHGVPGGLAKIPTTHAPVACGQCGGANHPTARACVSCGTALDGAVESESARALRSSRT